MAPKGKTAVPPKKEEKVVAPPPKTTPEVAADEATTTSALATKAASEMQLVGSAPAWLTKAMGDRPAAGFEKMDTADMILPRLVLMQSIMRDVQEGNFNAGDLVDNITREVIAAKGTRLRIIPIALSKSRIYFDEMDKGGKTLCRADDALEARAGGAGKDEAGKATRDCATCIYSKWDDAAEDMKDRKPPCTLFYNVVCLLPDRGYLPYVWSLKTTSVPVAKRFLTSGKQTGADMFALSYEIFAELEKGEQFTYMNYNFGKGEWVTEPEYNRAKAFYLGLSGKTWAPSTVDLGEEVAAEDVDASPEPDTSFPPKEEKAVNSPPAPKADAPAAEGDDGF